MKRVLGMMLAAGCLAAAGVDVDLKAAPEFEWLTVARAKTTAADLLKQAGVEVRWRKSNAAIGIRFVEAAPEPFARGALAFALPFSREAGGITVFLERVRPLLPKRAEEAGAVLGHVLAHEIAHVIASTDAHSPEGVMKASWSDRDLYRMTVGGLRFEEKDILAMRRAIAKRVDR